MSAKSSQKVPSGQGYGTDNPKAGQSIKTPGKAPALGAVGEVPDRSSPESVKGGRS